MNRDRSDRWNGGSRRVLGILLGMTVTLGSAGLAAEPTGPGRGSWAPLKFLLGDWVGEGGGKPGQGTGRFSFLPDLQGRILVRKSRAEYPPAADRPASVHEDLMVIHQEDPPAMKAIYFDNEGHVIRYDVTASGDGGTVTFLSEAVPSSPRFRLTYSKTGDRSLALRFEMAPPGKPDSFAPYIEAKAHRK